MSRVIERLVKYEEWENKYGESLSKQLNEGKEVVRCGECKWRKAKMMPKSFKCLFSGNADDFCSYGKVSEKPTGSEKPNNCDTCRNKGFEGCEQPCLGCGCCGLYEPKDEPTISKMEQVGKEK